MSVAFFSCIPPGIFLVAVRMVAMCNTFPMLVEYAIPLRIRWVLALCLTLVIWPTAVGSAAPLGGDSLVTLALREAVIGMSFGLSVGILLSSVRVVAGMVDVGSLSLWGTHFAEGGEAADSTAGQLFLWVGLLAFLGVHGERQVLAAFLDSYTQLPIGGRFSGPNCIEGLLELLRMSLMLGWRVALPISCASLFALVSMACLGRLAPGGQAMYMAIPTLQLASLAVLMVSLGSITWMYAREIERGLVLLQSFWK